MRAVKYLHKKSPKSKSCVKSLVILIKWTVQKKLIENNSSFSVIRWSWQYWHERLTWDMNKNNYQNLAAKITPMEFNMAIFSLSIQHPTIQPLRQVVVMMTFKLTLINVLIYFLHLYDLNRKSGVWLHEELWRVWFINNTWMAEW